MALTFEFEKALGAGAKPALGHEMDNGLWQYKLLGKRLDNFVTFPPNGQYDVLNFAKKPSMITARQVSDFGVKHLPGFGAYCYFTPMYQDSSFVLCPIHNKQTLGKMPVVTITPLAEGFRFDISSTEEYECYRIEFLKDYFTEEYITYAVDGTAQYDVVPELAGTLDVIVTGYSEEISIASNQYWSSVESAGKTPFPSPTGARTFLELLDTPLSYAEMQGKVVDVKSDESGLAFVDKNTNQVVTLTVAGWSNNAQTITVPGATSTNTIFVSPAPASHSGYVSAGVFCSAQGTDSLTFTCTSVPLVDLSISVVIL